MMDFFIVFTSMIDLILSSVDLPFIKILRLLRTLRPLRFISHNISMKLVIVALFESIGGIFNVIVVVLIVWLMFAILGVNLFSGKFQYCSEKPYKLRTLEECVQARAEWLTFDSNFDNVGSAMLTLFIVASQENWPDIMHQAIDSAGEREGPRQDSTPAAAYFFISFMMIGSYFFLNFFIGVLFLKYN
jgi:Ion transport protein